LRNLSSGWGKKEISAPLLALSVGSFFLAYVELLFYVCAGTLAARGLEELFFLLAVESVFGSGGK
jgi:hypothetical protein